jgi:hypothetical protein
MSDTRKSILKKPNGQQKTKKHRVRIYSPGNQTMEFAREFGKSDVVNLWSTNQDLQTALHSKEDKDSSRSSSSDRRQKKKRHVHYQQMKENDVFYNRKKSAKEAALKARARLGINDVDSPIRDSNKPKRVGKIVWSSSPAEDIREAVSTSQDKHSRRSMRSAPVIKKLDASSPKTSETRKIRHVRSTTLWERMFGKYKSVYVFI